MNESCKITPGIAKNKTDTFLVAIKNQYLLVATTPNFKLLYLYSNVSLSIPLPDFLSALVLQVFDIKS